MVAERIDASLASLASAERTFFSLECITESELTHSDLSHSSLRQRLGSTY